MTESDKRIALEILAKRKIANANRKVYNINEQTHAKQLLFASDSLSQVIACCSRRAGKTEGIAHDLVNTTLKYRGQAQIYTTLNRLSGIRIIWRTLKGIFDKYEIETKENLANGEILVNGDTPIYVGGAKDLSSIEVYRGNKYKKAFIDEAQSFKKDIIKTLVEDIFTYAVIDYNGSIKLTGTPPPSCAGYFADCWHGKQGEWSKHFFTMKDNSYLLNMTGKSYDQLVAEILKKRQVNIDDGSFRREFLGEWVKESDSMIYKYNETINSVNKQFIPKDLTHFVMGIDIGFDDADAIVIWGFNPDKYKKAFCVHTWKESRCDITTLAEKIKGLNKFYNIVSWVMDTGGLGKKILEELRNRHGLPCIKAASKSDKYGFIEVFNDALRRGDILIDSESEYIDELVLLKKDDNGKEDGDFDNHLCDAGLYGYREAYAYIFKEVYKPKHGSDEYFDELIKKQIEKEVEHELKLNESEYDVSEEKYFDYG